MRKSNRSSDPFARRNRGGALPVRTLTSALAMATILALPARESLAANGAFAGSHDFPSGVSFSQGSNSDTITLNTPSAIINWTPSDSDAGSTPIDFLPSTGTVTFRNDPSLQGGYTVINRVLPAGDAVGRGIALNGRITAELRDAQNAVIGNGGRVWFYSPGGILVGSTARIDVGGLFLSTWDFTDGEGNLTSTSDPNNRYAPITLSAGELDPQAPLPTIEIQSGAIINALGTRYSAGGPASGSYVALVSSSVKQSGQVNVDGSAAYVTGEDVEFTINDGLFDIIVNTGADGTVEHDGSTRWPTASTAPVSRAIYLVSVAKNDALTMALNPATLGFDTAVSATRAADGTIILSGGHNIRDGEIAEGSDFASSSSININGGLFRGNVVAQSNENAWAASLTGTAQFSGDVALIGRTSAHLGARQSGVTMAIGGHATVDASRIAEDNEARVSGGEALVYADNGGLMTVGKDLKVLATANGFFAQGEGSGVVEAQGGSATLKAENGRITVTGGTQIRASATNIGFIGADNQGQASIGGQAELIAATGSMVTLTKGLVMDTGAATSRSFGDGATAESGNINVNVSGGSSLTINPVTAQAPAASLTSFATAGSNEEGGDAAFADGGNINVTVGSGSSLTLGGTLLAQSLAIGGNTSGGQGGDAYAGVVSVLAEGNLNAGLIELHSGGKGGNGSNGGVGYGEATRLMAANGGSISASQVILAADGEGGVGSFSGGRGEGGLAYLHADRGGITVTGTAELSANGKGGNGTVGGEGVGGRPYPPGEGGEGGEGGFPCDEVCPPGGGFPGFPGFPGGAQLPPGGVYGAFVTTLSGTIDIGSTLTAKATGQGGRGSPGGGGGDAQGGYVEVQALPADIAQPGLSRVKAGSLVASASAFGGVGLDSLAGGEMSGSGGTASGGNMLVAATAGVGRIEFGSTTLTARGEGGYGGTGMFFEAGGGDGGRGTGGNIQTGVISGPSTPSTNGSAALGVLTADAGGLGGGGGSGANGGSAGNGGEGGGGTVLLSGFGGTTTAGAVTLTAIGERGRAGTDGSGGPDGTMSAATGGKIFVQVSPRAGGTAPGTMTLASLTIDVSGSRGMTTGQPDTEAGTFAIATRSEEAGSGGTLTVNGATTLRALGDLTGSAHNKIDAVNGTIRFRGAVTALATGPVDLFYGSNGGTIIAESTCTINAVDCGLPPPPPPPPVVTPPPPPVVTPPPPPPLPPVVTPPPPPPPPVTPPPPPPPPPPVTPPPPPPPPPVTPPPPPPPPPVTETPPVVVAVRQETSTITSNLQASLTGARVAGGSIGSTSGTVDTGATSSNGTTTTSSTNSTSSGGTATASASGSDGSSGSAADEGGDDEASDAATSSAGGSSVAGPNVLIDTSRVGTAGPEVDTPITSSGNSSLWQGADGLGEAPGTNP